MLAPDPRQSTRRWAVSGWMPRFAVLLGACLLASCASSARTSGMETGSATTADARAAGPFVGDWAYRQSCGWQHSAQLSLRVADDGRIAGTWSDGTRVRGEHGEVRGEVRGDRLQLRFCREGEGENACPRFATPADYAQRRGETLVWYRAFGTSHREYLSLHAVIPGRSIPEDSRCPEED
jgi:hypothetical protein